MAPPRGPIRWLDRLGLRRPRPDESVTWEIEHHISELADRLVSGGWDPERARLEAERRFGDRDKYVPPMRRIERGRLAMEGWIRWWELFRQSLVSVVRTARRYPGFTAGVVLTLGLGVGANATMYGIVDRLLLQPPAHIEDPDGVKRVFGQRPNTLTGGMSTGSVITYPDYADLKDHEELDGVAAYYASGPQTVGSGESARRARVALATAELFPLLGVQPLIGRFFTRDEAAPGASPTAVVSHEYWRSAHAGDPAAVGRSIDVEGRRHTIVGVLPPHFTGVDLARIDIWLPLELTQVERGMGSRGCLESRNCWWLSAVVRLADGVSVEAAEAQATALHLAGRRELIEQGRYSDRARIVFGPLIASRGPEASDESRVARWLAGVSLIVLLIACANVANLLMARGTRQAKDVGVRLALGAARHRVVAHAVAESLLLATAGGALALVIARWGGEIVRSTLLPGVYFPGSALTPRLLGFTVLAALVAGLFSGVVPALQGSRIDVSRSLQAGARGSSAKRSSIRGTLTVFQAAMSVVLLVGAGLFVRSLDRVRSVDLGLDVDEIAMVLLEPAAPSLDAQSQTRLYEEAMRRVTALPAVASAAATSSGLGSAYATRLHVPGLDSIPRLTGGGPYYYAVSPTYFETVGLAIVRGRGIEASDGPDDPSVTVVSRTMARTLWPDTDALGRCVMIGAGVEECTTVVGVVEDAARNGFQDEPFMAYYLPSSQSERPLNGMYVRAAGGADQIVDDVSDVLRSFSPDVRYTRVQTLREMLDPQARSWTLGATMFTVFGLLALIVASIGLYSVLAFDVAQRTRELGIRSALGAEKARLMASVLVQGTRLGVLGIAVGLASAYVAAPYVRDLLFEVSPREPLVLAAVATVLLAVSVTASFLPGLRATRVDPVAALKSE